MSNSHCYQLNVLVYPFDQLKFELAYNEAQFFLLFLFSHKFLSLVDYVLAAHETDAVK
jgi:hypothetical protein